MDIHNHSETVRRLHVTIAPFSLLENSFYSVLVLEDCYFFSLFSDSELGFRCSCVALELRLFEVKNEHFFFLLDLRFQYFSFEAENIRLLKIGNLVKNFHLKNDRIENL